MRKRKALIFCGVLIFLLAIFLFLKNSFFPPREEAQIMNEEELQAYLEENDLIPKETPEEEEVDSLIWSRELPFSPVE